MDGVTRVTVVRGLSHPWGLTVYQNHLYYTDLDYEVIERVDKESGANMVVMRSGMSGLRALKVHARDSMWTHKCPATDVKQKVPQKPNVLTLLFKSSVAFQL